MCCSLRRQRVQEAGGRAAEWEKRAGVSWRARGDPVGPAKSAGPASSTSNRIFKRNCDTPHTLLHTTALAPPPTARRQPQAPGMRCQAESGAASESAEGYDL